MLIWALGLQIMLNKFSSGSIWVPCIQHVQQNIRRVNNFIKFLPNSLGLPFEENSVLNFLSEIMNILLMKIHVVLRIVFVVILPSLR